MKFDKKNFMNGVYLDITPNFHEQLTKKSMVVNRRIFIPNS